MRSALVLAAIIVSGVITASAAEPADPADLTSLYKTLHATSAIEAPRLLQTDDGYVQFIGSPPGGYFEPPASAVKSATPETTAYSFIAAHAGAFGPSSATAGFRTRSVKATGTRTYVKLQQRYGGIEVFGASSVIQLNNNGGVICAYADIMRDTESLDAGSISLTPALSAGQAETEAKAKVTQLYGYGVETLSASDTHLVIFAPEVLGQNGTPRLAWVTDVSCSQSDLVRERVIVNAASGAVLLSYPLVHSALDREVYDAEFTNQEQKTLVRAEGDLPCNIKDADLAYDYFGDTYTFYDQYHGRDSIDNDGMTLIGTVQYRDSANTPYANAYWDGEQMVFGEDMVVDDVVAHELTHGVTDYESNLIYWGESGAINESFSDIWGEFVDLVNGRGNDADYVRWFMGEDLEAGAIRCMSDPTLFGDPDRKGSPNWMDTTSWLDNGGVHINSGVGNKLCYLLTDGDSFNGYTVAGMGIEKVAKLFYELQTNLLGPSSDYADLASLMGQAMVNLGIFSIDERVDARRAALAVEILEEDLAGYSQLRATPTFKGDSPVILLSWDLPEDTSAVYDVSIVRRTDRFPQGETDGDVVYSGLGAFYIDGADGSFADQAGTSYYYGLYANMASGFPRVAFARAVIPGDDTPPTDFLTQAFDSDSASEATIMNYTQITFAPTGDPDAIDASGSPANYVRYEDYYATAINNVDRLPVPREDENGAAFSLIFREDGVYELDLGESYAVTFFGVPYQTIYLSENGFITFDREPELDENFPSVASHFAMRRLSFFFADLSLGIGGNAWGRYLDDRLVITYENVPEFRDSFPVSAGNTFQLELFFSGHIRCTYLEAHAENLVIGLSDGRGVPQKLTADGTAVEPVTNYTSFAELLTNGQSDKLTIDPIKPFVVEEGDDVVFTVIAHVPADASSPLVLSAEWNSAEPVPFDPDTGIFQWQTANGDAGLYTVRITARAGNLVAFQDVYIYVSETLERPTVTDLILYSDDPQEDPTQSRTVSSDSALHASYTVNPGEEGEDATILQWFRNNAMVHYLTNNRTVPRTETVAGDTWFYQVTPATQVVVDADSLFSSVVRLVGTAQRSPVVTVVGGIDVPIDPGTGGYSLTPNEGTMAGGTEVHIFGEGLNNPVSVKFGGVEAYRVYAEWTDGLNSDVWLRVITPLHPAGTVDVEIRTGSGLVTLTDAFTFKDANGSDGDDTLIPGLGCHAGTPSDSTGGGVAMVVLACAVLGIASIRRRVPTR